MKKSNKKGFTIVELVIVIAVIAILATVLIPTFSGVIQKANASSRLQTARNAYTEYYASLDAEDLAAPINAVIEVTKGNDKYYYVVSAGEFKAEELTSKPAGYADKGVGYVAHQDAVACDKECTGGTHVADCAYKAEVAEVAESIFNTCKIYKAN